MPTHPNVNPFYIEPASRAAWEEDIDGPIDEVELEGELLLPQRQTPRPDYRNPRRRRRGHASPRANRHLLCIFATILIVLLLLLSSRSSNKDSTASSQEPSSHHDGGTIPHIQQTTHPTTRISTNAPSTAPKVVVTPAPSVPVVDTEMPTVPQTPEETGAPTTDAPVTLTPTVQPTPNTLPPTLPPHNTPISTAQPTTVSSETTTPTLASGNPPATTVLPTPPPHDTLTPSTQPTKLPPLEMMHREIDPDTVDWDAIPCTGHLEGQDLPKDWENCDLSNFSYGRPVLMISAGRSGSSVTWDTMANLASEPDGAGLQYAELPGNNYEQAMEQLQGLDPLEHGKCWMQRMLCARQYRNFRKKVKNRSKVHGIKWKPFTDAFNHTKAKEALDWVAHSPHIKVVYNDRNPLDVVISGYKHKMTSIPTHCRPGDQKCLDEFMAQDDIVIPVDYIVHSLAKLVQDTNLAVQMMDEHKVKRLHVSYERLYYGVNDSDLCEWRELLSYVMEQPYNDLTRADIQAHMDFAATHPKSRQESIGNYEEVEAALHATEFAPYLIPPTKPISHETKCRE